MAFDDTKNDFLIAIAIGVVLTSVLLAGLPRFIGDLGYVVAFVPLVIAAALCIWLNRFPC